MSNSSPTARERVLRAAMMIAYANARMLGYDGAEAAREAWEVVAFIKKIAEECDALR